MAKKKWSYRIGTQEAYEHYVKMAEYYQKYYGLQPDRVIEAPHYKESRRRNWLRYVDRVESVIDKLRKQANAIDAANEYEAYKYEEDRAEDDWFEPEPEPEPEWEEIPEEKSPWEEEYERVQLDEALYENYMARLYYYQFIPEVKALIDTIEGDDDLKKIIIKELQSQRGVQIVEGNSTMYHLPTIDFSGSYEYGSVIARGVADFLELAKSDPFFDEGYAEEEYY